MQEQGHTQVTSGAGLVGGWPGCCFVSTVPRTASVLVGLGLCMSAQSSGPGLQQNSLPFGLAAWGALTEI